MDVSFTEAPGGSVWLLAPLGGALRFVAAGVTKALQRRWGVAEDGEGAGGRSVNGARTHAGALVRRVGRRLVPRLRKCSRGTLAAARGGLAAPPPSSLYACATRRQEREAAI